MQIVQSSAQSLASLPAALPALNAISPDLVLVFASARFYANPEFFETLRATLPANCLVGCSTAGEIAGLDVLEFECALTAIRFDGTPVRIVDVPMPDSEASFQAGQDLADALRSDLNGQALSGIVLFGPGTAVNGSAIIEGLHSRLPSSLPISGGLAGDDGAFKQTFVLSPSGVHSDSIVGVGLYGPSICLTQGSSGGWHPFGPTRRVTRCDGNILYTLDDEPALDIYKRYLGDYAKDLPASGLLFPFEMLSEAAQPVGLIRTIQGIDEDAGSLLLAGSVEQGGYLRLMHASTDALIAGAETAAVQIQSSEHNPTVHTPTLALLISCVGRKLVMGDRVDEEVEAVHDLLTSHLKTPPFLSGFYSYGEINPLETSETTCFHNQTMTIALLSERTGAL